MKQIVEWMIFLLVELHWMGQRAACKEGLFFSKPCSKIPLKAFLKGGLPTMSSLKQHYGYC